MPFVESSNRHFEPKSPEKLEKQVESAKFFLGQTFIPTEYIENIEEIMKMSAEEIKEKYPDEYEKYLDFLREYKKIEKKGQGDLDSKEMKRFKLRLRLDGYVCKVLEGEKETHLREHQVSVFEDLRNFLKSDGDSCYVELPTGTGKTVIFIEFLRVLGVPAVIVVPTRDLVQQTQDRINEFAKELDVGAVDTDSKNYGAKTVVTTYNSLEEVITNPGFDLGELGVVILDEAHKALSDNRQKIVEDLKKETLVIGFTATPEYSETKNVGNLLGEKIHEMSLLEAIESRALAPCSAMVAKTKCDISGVKISNGDFDVADLDKAINIEKRNKAVAQLATETFKDKKKIIFCGTVKHAENVAQKINEVGGNEVVEIVVGKTQDVVNKKYTKMGYEGGWKEAYEKGVITTVISASLILEGTDLPSAEVCINAVPTKSLVRATQRGGRVTRLDPNNPHKHAIVVDVVDAGDDKKYKTKSVLFFQILGSNVVVPSGSEQNNKSDMATVMSNEKISDLHDFVIIDGLEVVVDLEEMKNLVYVEKNKEEKLEEYISFIKEKFDAINFLMIEDRSKFKIKSSDGKEIGLVALSSQFNIRGNPIRDFDIHTQLAEEIYGKDEVQHALEEIPRRKNEKIESLKEKYISIIKSTLDIGTFLRMSAPERYALKIKNSDGKEIGKIALYNIFSIGDTNSTSATFDNHIQLAKEIYGERKVEEFLSVMSKEEEKSLEQRRADCRKRIISEHTVEDFLLMRHKTDFKVTIDSGEIFALISLSNLFAIEGNPIVDYNKHIQLAKEIYGEKEVEEFLKVQQVHYRDIIKNKMSIEEYVFMSLENRRRFVITEGYLKNIKDLAKIFPIDGNPVEDEVSHIQLAKDIYGERKVEEVLEKQKEYLDAVIREFKKIGVNKFLTMITRDRRKFKITINGEEKILKDIAKIFFVEGDIINNGILNTELAKKIYGEEAVNEVLSKNK